MNAIKIRNENSKRASLLKKLPADALSPRLADEFGQMTVEECEKYIREFQKLNGYASASQISEIPK